MYLQGVPPATVAEWTLQGDGFLDWYDGEPISSKTLIRYSLFRLVSLVDGYNLPAK